MTSIQCPNCKTAIDIDQVLAHQIEEALVAKHQQHEQQALAEQEQKLKRELWNKAQVAAKSATEKQLADLQLNLAEQTKKLQQANQDELELRKKQRQLEDEKRQYELKLERELTKRLEDEREKISKLEFDRFSIKEKEQQKQIADLRASLEEAHRKVAASVSQQLQGETLELELEQLLRTTFPYDTIEEVKKGQLGADVHQTVKNHFGKSVGIIVWEFKQTEHFSDKWLSKLREDTRACHGALSVLVTRTLPADIKTCAERDHVWITGVDFVLPLAELLRQTLVRVDQEKTAQSGKDVKTEMLYQYINSHEFRGRIEGIVESFREMKDDLDKEQRALQNSWKKREKQILRLATNAAFMYGEMQGLVGSSLPNIQGLDLEFAPAPSIASSAEAA